MAIVNVLVHPKGATHKQVLNYTTYWLKQIDGVWHFHSMFGRWLFDATINEPNYWGMHLVKSIR